jgi:hypothetical protein
VINYKYFISMLQGGRIKPWVEFDVFSSVFLGVGVGGEYTDPRDNRYFLNVGIA